MTIAIRRKKTKSATGEISHPATHVYGIEYTVGVTEARVKYR